MKLAIDAATILIAMVVGLIMFLLISFFWSPPIKAQSWNPDWRPSPRSMMPVPPPPPYRGFRSYPVYPSTPERDRRTFNPYYRPYGDIYRGYCEFGGRCR